MVVDGCTAMGANGNWQVGVYPNPFNNLLEVQIPVGAELKLFNAAGELVIEQEVSAGHARLNVKDLPFGMYFLKVQTGGVTSTHKLIKE
jgi:hypothetical protein